MNDKDPIGGTAPLDYAPPELSYPGLSPQLLARVKQLWSARGLDLDLHWRAAVRTLPGFRAVPRIDDSPNSAQVDLVFLFDQSVIWIRALQAAASQGRDHAVDGLSPAQWQGLSALAARLTEQLTALRLLALNDLPMPAMQIARSLSEDVDMALVLMMRPKLAQRFVDCRTVEEANDFWRRHIAGGRAFRTISEQLYSVGIDHSADTDYARWRRQVLTTLGAAVHSNALGAPVPERRPGAVLLNDDSLHFATFRVQELCAYALLVRPGLTDILNDAGAPDAHARGPDARLAPLAAPMSMILVNQIQSLISPSVPPAMHRMARRH